MAGEWIKVRTNLWDDPRVSRLCDLTGAGEAAVIGALYWLWASADEHTEDGHMPGLSIAAIDRKTGVRGIGAALLEIGWISENGDGLNIERFGEHNGASAKRRALDAQRKATVRNVSASDADKEKTESGQNAPDCGAREEKIREKDLNPSNPNGLLVGNEVAGQGQLPVEGENPPSVVTLCTAPACPHQEIIDLYHEFLPMGTQVRTWTGTREAHLRSRWREDGKRQNLDWWRRLFAYAAKSKFITGQVAPTQGRSQFVVSLEWIVTPRNFARLIEGYYHREAA